jgi:homospermidine synthase
MRPDMVITILGSAGGVARAVLSLLNDSARNANSPLHSVLSTCQLHLVDRKQKNDRYYNKLLPAFTGRFVSHQFSLTRIPRLRQHLKQTVTTLVIDVSWGDTVEILRCCNGLGVAYVNTALENTMIDTYEEEYAGFGLAERVKILEAARDDFTNTSAIIGSGMNPGVVQWMALELAKQNTGKPLLGCYVVELDNSFYADKSRAQPDTIYTTWSPECFLDEAILNHPMFVSQGTPVFLYDQVYALEFQVTLGPKRFYGSLMAHEEVLSLGRLLHAESGFLYRVNDHTTDLIRNNLDKVDDLWDWEMEVLDPTRAPLEGSDLVGILLVYEDEEHFMYNEMHNQDVFNRFGVNATYFQVACGVYAGLASLLLDPIPQGVYYVDELLLNTQTSYGHYLSFYMPDFAVGKNEHTDGLLLQRMKRADL